MFHRGNAVYAQPLAWEKLALSGEPVRIADEVGYVSTTAGAISPRLLMGSGVLSSTGNISVSWADVAEWQLVWVDGRRSARDSGPPA